ncbi:MAG: UbiA family prenyltransferase [Bradyrhizobium sp.]|uniref:UbiA family prenyltransferase n=1 Tax=Bradyrhizobium sp. TaxID=376 RepID=UPI0025BB21D4|nr:UbiA family prenyltransferase [Bradyrhizobium sp.]MBI5265147.1 UbiA family prenyltransferase [Bradyrhizobium sp.]
MDPVLQWSATPLVVDLEGALIRSNLWLEFIFAHLAQNGFPFDQIAKALRGGKATLKSHIAATTTVDVAELPYDEEVLSLVRDSVVRGIPVYLVSRHHERHVRAVAQHLGLFTGWLASTGEADLSQAAKARLLTDTFGQHGFDYVGTSGEDYPIWVVARKRFATRESPATRAKLAQLDRETVFLKSGTNGARAWAKLLRVHQWAKNALVFVPLVTAHRFDLPALGSAIAAFVAFSLAASAIYILNDLVDIEADRKHPTKKNRPLAAGTVPMAAALSTAGVLVVASTTLAFFVTAQLAGVLVFYLLLTTAYSFYLKRKMLVDVIALAVLYTARVVAGAAAVAVPLSEWLLVFSILIFTGLALMKRYIELAARLDADLPDPSNRDYRKSDLSVVAALAAGAAFNAVTVFALYISSDTVHHLYRRPDALWLICPILMYWLSRILMLAHRRAMDDDPILFALKDLNSLVAFGLIAEILYIAT